MAIFGGKKQLEEENNRIIQENAQLKSQISSLVNYQTWAQQRIAQLEQLTSSDVKERESAISNLQQTVAAWQKSLEEYQVAHKNWEQAIALKQEELSNTEKSVEEIRKQIAVLETEIENKKAQIVSFDDEILAQEFGLYKPRFNFTNVEQYKEKLKEIRDGEKQVVKRINEQANNSKWTVNGSNAQGRKMVSDICRLLMTAFNGACDDIIRRVKFSNIEKSVDSIDKQADKISKYGRVIGISIPAEYISLKKSEAYVSYEYAKFKEEEKERLREQREREREEKKLAKEIAEKRKKLEKERKQYQQELTSVYERLKGAEGETKEALEAKKAELEEELTDNEKAKEDVDYREANQRAGYVYVISNIGSFGDDVFKIGMTRRLDPYERIRELGDVSVPFKFDVHAMIFTDDAPGLESTLHKEFEDRKLNLVNQRREFFKCSLEEIKSAILKNYDKTVEFTDFPDAEQFRISEKMRNASIK